MMYRSKIRSRRRQRAERVVPRAHARAPQVVRLGLEVREDAERSAAVDEGRIAGRRDGVVADDVS
jgi:hypothetical protein